MSDEKRAATGGRWYYGWVIVAICAGVVFVSTGTRGSLGAFFKAIQDETGWDRATIAGAAGVNAAAWALAQPLAGYFVDRFGPKRTMIGGTLILVGAVIPLYWATSVWQLYLFFGLLPGLGYAAATILPFVSLLARWFHARQGLASGIVAAALPIGQAVAVPLAAVLNEQVGWRLGYLLLGIPLVAILLPMVLLLRDRPRPGEMPAAEQQGGRTRAGRDTPRLAGYTGRTALRTPEFWLVFLSQTICGFGDWLVAVHLVPFISDQDQSVVFAGAIQGATGIVAIGGTIAGGWLCDRFDRKLTLFLMHGSRVLCLPMLIAFGMTGHVGWLLAFVPLYGLTIMVGFPATSMLVARLYGVRAVGAIYGNTQIFHHLAMAAGAYAGGVIFDAAHSYYPAFALGAALSLIAAVGVLRIDERPAAPAARPLQAPSAT